jgi:DNA primase
LISFEFTRKQVIDLFSLCFCAIIIENEKKGRSLVLITKEEVFKQVQKELIDLDSVSEVASQRKYIHSEIVDYLKEHYLGFASFSTPSVELYENLGSVGWLDKGSFTLAGRVVVPIRNVDGSIATLVGWRKGFPKYYTIADKDFSKESHWFNLDRALEKSFKGDKRYRGTVVVVEGIFDALHLDAYGIPAIATMGSDVNAYKGSMLSLFDKIICIPDNDSAGQKALLQKRWQVPSSASFLYVEEKRYQFGEGLSFQVKDIDNFLSLFGSQIHEVLVPLVERQGSFIERLSL